MPLTHTPDIRHLLRETCTLIHAAATDEWGEPVGATTEEDVPCRFEFEGKMVRDNTGEEVVAQGEVFLYHSVDVESVARIRFAGREYSILTREHHKMGDNPTHWEVWVK